MFGSYLSQSKWLDEKAEDYCSIWIWRQCILFTYNQKFFCPFFSSAYSHAIKTSFVLFFVFNLSVEFNSCSSQVVFTKSLWRICLLCDLFPSVHGFGPIDVLWMFFFFFSDFMVLYVYLFFQKAFEPWQSTKRWSHCSKRRLEMESLFFHMYVCLLFVCLCHFPYVLFFLLFFCFVSAIFNFMSIICLCHFRYVLFVWSFPFVCYLSLLFLQGSLFLSSFHFFPCLCFCSHGCNHPWGVAILKDNSFKLHISYMCMCFCMYDTGWLLTRIQLLQKSTESPHIWSNKAWIYLHSANMHWMNNVNWKIRSCVNHSAFGCFRHVACMHSSLYIKIK